MALLRKADPSHLSAIYNLQNIPQRELIMIFPLPPVEEFSSRARTEMLAEREHYFLLETDGRPVGFLWISQRVETCEIWGRHLHTLFYACAWAAFDYLNMVRLKWIVRHTNKRMLAVCERFQIRKTDEQNFCVFGPKLEFIAAGQVYCYELTPIEYRKRIALMQKYSLQWSTFFGDPPII